MPNDERQLALDDQLDDAAYIPLDDVLADAYERSGLDDGNRVEHDRLGKEKMR